MTRRRLRRKLPWIPPAEDDELQRQLDLFVWAKAYQQSMRGAKQGFVWELMQLPQEPSILDYEDMRQFCRAREIWESRFQRLVDRRDMEPFQKAARIVLRAAEASWHTTRQLVYERDGGFCMVCGDAVPWKYYECGHIVDRVVGGSDRLSNLVLMCNLDNRTKPLTETRAAYLAWARHRGTIKHIWTLALQKAPPPGRAEGLSASGASVPS